VKIRSNIVLKVCLVVSLLLVGLTLAGCIGIRGTPVGGSGAVIANGTLFLCPGLKQVGGGGCSAPIYESKLVAVNLSDGSRLWGENTPKLSGAVYSNPAVDGDRVYVTDYSGRVCLIYASTHSLSVDVSLDKSNPQPIIGGPVVAGGRVYIGSSDHKVYALDGENLEPVWSEPFATGGKIWSTPVIDGDTLYIGSFDKKLYAIDTETGSEKWQFETEGAIIATPLVYNGTVYIGSFDRRFYAVNASNGTAKWDKPFEAEEWFWAKPLVYNDVIYAPCLDGRVYALDAQTGDKINEFDLDSPISSSPVLAGSLVIVASQAGKVYAIDTGNNQKSELKDLAEEVYAPLCADEGVIYICSQEQNLYALSVESGTTLWSLSLK
jgi:outer membrane protein assembly factor BamB